VAWNDTVHILTIVTVLQASALKIALEKKNLHANIYVGMRYWYPFTEEAIDQVRLPALVKL
jgi:protoporphyrin/coproporphyrin ferrochelatase